MVEYKKNRFCPEEKYYIDYVVLKNLFRALKKRHLYAEFRCSIGIAKNTKMSFVYRLFKNAMAVSLAKNHTDNPFKECESLEGFYQVLDDAYGGPRDMTSDENVQHRIISSLNFMLHVLFERIVGNIRTVESVGEEVFNATCEELFGKGFKDLTAPPDVDMELIRQVSQSLREGRPLDLTPEQKAQLDRFAEFVRNNARMNMDEFGERVEEEIPEWEFEDGEDWV